MQKMGNKAMERIVGWLTERRRRNGRNYVIELDNERQRAGSRSSNGEILQILHRGNPLFILVANRPFFGFLLLHRVVQLPLLLLLLRILSLG